MALWQIGDDLADQGRDFALFLLGDQLFLGGGVLGCALVQATSFQRVDGKFADPMLRPAVERPVRRSSNPGIDLAGAGYLLRFVQEALAGVLHGVLDFLGRALGVLRRELDPQCAGSLSLDEAAQERGGILGGERGSASGVHHYNRVLSDESGPPFRCRCTSHEASIKK